jgi:hypothetical protein
MNVSEDLVFDTRLKNKDVIVQIMSDLSVNQNLSCVSGYLITETMRRLYTTYIIYYNVLHKICLSLGCPP